MKNKQGLLITFGLIAIVLLGFWNLKQKNSDTPIINERIVQEFKVELTIENGKTNETFDISQYIGRTALEATQSVLNGNVKMTGTGQNAFVTGINGREADTKKHEFWELLVNGKQAEVGAGTYIIQNFDNIVWKISTY